MYPENDQIWNDRQVCFHLNILNILNFTVLVWE